MADEKLLAEDKITLTYEEWLKIDEEIGDKNEIAKKKRARGFGLEKLIYSVLYYEKMEPIASYGAEGEQIDGAFFYGTDPFLLEAKWHKEPKEASQVYAFKGKVDGKFHTTSGVFISMSGYSENCVEALRYGKTQNIILFDGSDMELIFKKEVSFAFVLRAKVKIASQKGEVYVPYRLERQITTAVKAMHTTTASTTNILGKTVLIISPDQQALHNFMMPELKKLDVSKKLNLREFIYITSGGGDYLSGIERMIAVTHAQEQFDAALIVISNHQKNFNPIELGEVNRRLFQMNIPVRLLTIQINKEHPSFDGIIRDNVTHFLEAVANFR